MSTVSALFPKWFAGVVVVFCCVSGQDYPTVYVCSINITLAPPAIFRYIMTTMLVSLRKTSLVDYPGKVASVIFFQGCNLRCPWCYNRELVLNSAKDAIELDGAFNFIEKRKRVLGGVVLSGGEPTLQSALGDIIAKIKNDLSLNIKLDTNGTHPDILKKLFAEKNTRPDFIAMDVKLPAERYIELTPNKIDVSPEIIESIKIIKESGVEHEFRTLKLPADYLKKTELETIKTLADDTLKIRQFYPGNCLDEAWNNYG